MAHSNNMIKGKVIIPADANPWPHEMRVAKILARAGHIVEFIPKLNIKTADILLDGIEFEIKSPKTSKANSLEHLLKKALEQSSNIIFDSSRMDTKQFSSQKLCNFLVAKARRHKQIKRLLLIVGDEIIDIRTLC